MGQVVYFLSESELKENSVINDNVDMKLLDPIIIEAQRIHIYSLLGTGLYNELCTEIIADNVSVLNKKLLDEYVLPCLIQYVKYEAAPELLYKIMNKSIVKKNSDNSQPIDLTELNFLRDMYKDKAEFFAQRIVLYLIQYCNDYPLYKNAGTGIDIVRPRTNAFSSAIDLDDFNQEYDSFRSNSRTGNRHENKTNNGNQLY